MRRETWFCQATAPISAGSRLRERLGAQWRNACTAFELGTSTVLGSGHGDGDVPTNIGIGCIAVIPGTDARQSKLKCVRV